MGRRSLGPLFQLVFLKSEKFYFSWSQMYSIFLLIYLIYVIWSRKLLDEYNHKYILLPSGINMHYVDEGDRWNRFHFQSLISSFSGDTNAPLIVCVHGYPEFWYSWRFQIEHLKSRYRKGAIFRSSQIIFCFQSYCNRPERIWGLF